MLNREDQWSTRKVLQDPHRHGMEDACIHWTDDCARGITPTDIDLIAHDRERNRVLVYEYKPATGTSTAGQTELLQWFVDNGAWALMMVDPQASRIAVEETEVMEDFQRISICPVPPSCWGTDWRYNFLEITKSQLNEIRDAFFAGEEYEKLLVLFFGRKLDGSVA